MDRAQIRAEWDKFIEYPSDDKSFVSTVSAQLFAEHIAKLQATQAEPMFWVRLRSDGGYEGPIHNAVIEDVRRMSGAWHPLYLGSEPVQAGELPDEREAFEAWAQKRLQLNIERCAPPEQGFYTWQSTMDAWMAWQARAALSATQPAQAAQGEPVARWITHARL